MAGTTNPYIGSKISLISNSEIRYEGILYTINTQESTIALQSVRSLGTEGRKYPEIPPSSEIYDFIIFRGQDIKDLTVLEGKGAHSSPQLNDPAIMSMNQRPPGGPPSKGAEKGGYNAKGKSSGKWGKEGTSKGWGKSDGGKGDGGYGDRSWGQSKGGGKGGYSTGKSSWDYGYRGDSGGGGGKGGKSKGKDKDEGKGKKGKDGGKSYDGKGKKGDGKKGDRDEGGKKGGKKGDRGGKGGRTGGGTSGHGIPIGELLPQEDAAVKRECAEDFDVENANTKFEKLKEEEELNKESATLGYDKAKSFFDSISCEATERASTADRQKVDRDKARQFDRETFGNTGRPPRPTGGGGKKGGKGKSKGKHQHQ
mmetsp:Transcript_43628/g.98284  ORF Transcript_43628/g.98284 Transcript_43628/m.98284 type:complete len:367 (-) Transcript_43628:60-1160(-)